VEGDLNSIYPSTLPSSLSPAGWREGQQMCAPPNGITLASNNARNLGRGKPERLSKQWQWRASGRAPPTGGGRRTKQSSRILSANYLSQETAPACPRLICATQRWTRGRRTCSTSGADAVNFSFVSSVAGRVISLAVLSSTVDVGTEMNRWTRPWHLSFGTEWVSPSSRSTYLLISGWYCSLLFQIFQLRISAC